MLLKRLAAILISFAVLISPLFAQASSMSATTSPLTIVSVTADKSTAVVGQSITWTVKTQGGSNIYHYLYGVMRDGELVVFTYSQKNTIKYTPTEPGLYWLNVEIEAEYDFASSVNNAYVTVTAPPKPKKPLKISNVSADKTSVAIGGDVTWQVTTKDGAEPKSYCYFLYKDGHTVYKGDYTSSDTFTYTLTKTGSYKLRAYVKDGTGKTLNKYSGTVKAVNPLTITSVKVKSSSKIPRVGRSITWTATTSGGNGTKYYRFVLYRDDQQIAGRAYKTSRTYQYKPSSPGLYWIQVFVYDKTGDTSCYSSGIIVK